jgi:DNA-binding response OmpR family regulator
MPRRRVLVVDDEPRILDIVKYFLEQGGFDVEAVTTGEAAVASARGRPADVAVLDIVLGPRTSGYDVAGKLKKLPGSEETPVLFMSSKVEMAELFLQNYDGRAEFILKPFKKDALLDAVRLLADGGGRQARKGRRLREKRA